MRHFLGRTLLVLVILGLIGLGLALGISAYEVHATEEAILPQADTPPQGLDCILVLGCGVRDSGEPSLMLQDRLNMGLRLYEAGAAPKLLMSGDHSTVDYDEVNAMKDYVMDRGVPSGDVFMDHAGFSTYESMYRARDVFCAEKILIVSQRYHLYRAVYDARALGLEAYGVAAEDIRYLIAFSERMANAAFCPVAKEMPQNMKDKLDQYLCRKRPDRK